MVLVAVVVLATIGVVVLLFLVITYNSLVNLKNLIRESWSDVETELKRRHDLIPNLVEVVKGYAAHERAVFEEVTRARTAAMNASGVTDAKEKENGLIRSLKTLFAVAENYPQLKANEHFLHLQQELVETEDRIQAARRFYNGNVRDYNNRVEMFPTSIVASLFGYKLADFFEIDELETKVPEVNLG